MGLCFSLFESPTLTNVTMLLSFRVSPFKCNIKTMTTIKWSPTDISFFMIMARSLLQIYLTYLKQDNWKCDKGKDKLTKDTKKWLRTSNFYSNDNFDIFTACPQIKFELQSTSILEILHLFQTTASIMLYRILLSNLVLYLVALGDITWKWAKRNSVILAELSL